MAVGVYPLLSLCPREVKHEQVSRSGAQAPSVLVF
jgi:hypothetical protein